jgi:tetratricopeptide (TPR) repeat protein
MRQKTPEVALTAAIVAATLSFPVRATDLPDPILAPGTLCAPVAGQPALLRQLILAKTETQPFQPKPGPAKAADAAPPLYPGLGTASFRITTKNALAQRYFNQGLRLSYGFNHAEAIRAFKEAQRLDPSCAMCFWGEAWALGPNINVPMPPEALAPAVAAAARAKELAAGATERERALIDAVVQRYSADPKAERAALDAAFAAAIESAVKRFPADDTIQVLFAESLMDLQPWDYWEAAGAKPKGRATDILASLETVLKRNPDHPGAIHLYIHAVEASTQPEKALPYARRLGALMPGAGHVVHMPAHIYYRVGLYRESLETNRAAMVVDENYFKVSPSDPIYKGAYYPHNVHFVLVSASMGGDAKTALHAAARLDEVIDAEFLKAVPMLQPVKAAPYFTHVLFSSPETILAIPDPGSDFVLVQAMWHYARSVAFSRRKDFAASEREIAAMAKIESTADYKPFADWGIPAKEIIQTATFVAKARLAEGRGDLAAAAKAYEDAIFVEDSLAYTEPPYWYYPIRQSLGAVLLRQGKLDEAEKAFRESLARVRNNGWSLYGLTKVYEKRGDMKSLAAAKGKYAQAWFGPKAGPDLSGL